MERKRKGALDTTPKVSALNAVYRQLNPKYKMCCVRELQALWCTDDCTWLHSASYPQKYSQFCHTLEDLQGLVPFQLCHKLFGQM